MGNSRGSFGSSVGEWGRLFVSPRSEKLQGARFFEQMGLQLLDPGRDKQSHRDMVE